MNKDEVLKYNLKTVKMTYNDKGNTAELHCHIYGHDGDDAFVEVHPPDGWGFVLIPFRDINAIEIISDNYDE